VDQTPNRRSFLGALFGGAAALTLPPSAFGAQASDLPVATPLSDNLILVTGAGANVVVLTSPDGLMLINGGLEDRSAGLLETVAAHAGRRTANIQVVFNTDWHRERTGSNRAAAAAGGAIIAHERTKEYLGADIYVDWQKRSYPRLPPQALPTKTFYTSDRMTFGTERVEYGHLGQAHTDAAIYVYLPGPNVLIAGDALSVAKYPIPDYTTGGWLGGLLAANKTLLTLANAETRIVPGVGPLQTRADLQAQHDMLAAMMDRLPKMMKQGLGPEDILQAAPTKEFDAAWGNPDLFVTTACRSLWLHVRELGGIV
jgi:cyclase